MIQCEAPGEGLRFHRKSPSSALRAPSPRAAGRRTRDRLSDDPSYSVLSRGGDQLILSSHRGDGEFGQAVVVLTGDVDALFRNFRERGLRTPGNADAPAHVHEGPIDQSWGTREFYVDDPDGNKLRFTRISADT